MYKVIVGFTDLQDRDYPYREGDTYPREGYTPSAARYRELSSTNNKRGMALIEKVPEPVTETEETTTEIVDDEPVEEEYTKDIISENAADEAE